MDETGQTYICMVETTSHTTELWEVVKERNRLGDVN
jgi:hypothetical protein